MLEMALTGVAVVLALTQPVPQIVRLLRTRSVAGVSGPTTWLGLVVNSGWLAYGVGRGLLPVAVLSAAYVAGYLTIGVLLLQSGTNSGLRAGVLAAAATTALATIAGWAVLGTVLAFAVGVQFVPQVAHAWRSTDLTGLSAGTYLVCLLDGLVWGGFGALVGDRPLVLYGLVMTTVAVLVLIPRQRFARAAAVLAG